MKTCFWQVIIFSSLFLLTGCTTLRHQISNLFADKEGRAKEIAALKMEYDKKLDAKIAEVSSAKDKVIAGKDSQISTASNGLFSADTTFKLIPSPTRTDLMINNFVNESWIALGRSMPDYQTLTKINERIQRELDETKTSIDQLKINHAKVMAENQKLADQTKASEKALKDLEKQKEEMAAKFSRDLDLKQTELLAVQDKLLELEEERAKNAESLKEMKLKFSMIAGGLALLALAGAIYSPIFKSEFAIFSGITGLISVGIWYLQPFHVGIAATLVVIGLIAWAALKYHKETKAATGVYRAIQSVKDTAKEDYDKILKPKLEQWLTKYDSKGKTVPDITAQQHIDKRLMEVGDK